MKDTLKPGITHEFRFQVTDSKTVPQLFPEAAEFAGLPKVFATGFMVGLVEWTCVQALKPHLDWPKEQSVGTDVKLNHTAATPPGFTVTVKVKLESVEGRKLTFSIEAHDGVDQITAGTHERFVIDAERFNARIAEKAAKAKAAG